MSAVNPLISALKDSNREVRINAAEALEQIKDPRALQALVDCFHKTYPKTSSDNISAQRPKEALTGAIDAIVMSSVDKISDKVLHRLLELEDWHEIYFPYRDSVYSSTKKVSLAQVRQQAQQELTRRRQTKLQTTGAKKLMEFFRKILRL